MYSNTTGLASENTAAACSQHKFRKHRFRKQQSSLGQCRRGGGGRHRRGLPVAWGQCHHKGKQATVGSLCSRRQRAESRPSPPAGEKRRVAATSGVVTSWCPSWSSETAARRRPSWSPSAPSSLGMESDGDRGLGIWGFLFLSVAQSLPSFKGKTGGFA